MGDFRVEVNATGGHGCQRELKNGSTVETCADPSCPDCIARRFVAELVDKGTLVKDALLIHWPSSHPTIVDNLISRKRNGNF